MGKLGDFEKHLPVAGEKQIDFLLKTGFVCGLIRRKLPVFQILGGRFVY
jgi:hypothetical protein